MWFRTQANLIQSLSFCSLLGDITYFWGWGVGGGTGSKSIFSKSDHNPVLFRTLHVSHPTQGKSHSPLHDSYMLHDLALVISQTPSLLSFPYSAHWPLLFLRDSFHHRAFALVDPSAWNTLPLGIVLSLTSFKSLFQWHLLGEAFLNLCLISHSSFLSLTPFPGLFFSLTHVFLLNIQAYHRDIVDLIPDHHNEVNTAIK